MKCKVIKTYRDKNTKEIIKEGTEIEVTKTRARELLEKGKIQYIEDNKKQKDNTENQKE